MNSQEARKLWMAVIGQLQLELPGPTFKIYLANTRAVSLENNDTLVVIAPSSFHIEFLQQRICSSILSGLERNHGAPLKVSYHLEGAKQIEKPKAPAKKINPHLRRGMTFSTFITGQCNEMPYKAAKTVASPSSEEEYNLLYIYGVPGMGKTHLLHAIGNQLAENGVSVTYMTSEDFITDFVLAVQNKKVTQLKSKYRSGDAFLLDDIGLIADKVKTEAHFVHTLDDMKALNKRVVLTGDMPAMEMGFGKRLATRISEGISLEVEPIANDVPTKTALAEYYLRECKVEASQDIAKLIGSAKLASISELIGMIRRAKTICTLNGKPLNEGDIRQIFKASDTSKNEKTITLDKVVSAVTDVTGVSGVEIIGRGRGTQATHARWLAMHFMNKVCGLSPEKIGKYMDNRSVQTINYGEKRLRDLASVDEVTKSTMSLIDEEINRPSTG